MVPVILRLLAASHKVSDKAGQIVRDVMAKGELGIVEKAKNDLQTEADRSASNCILASLAKLFPKATIISEEGKLGENVPSEWLISEMNEDILKLDCPAELEKISEEDVVIWVDPLDGTAEYTQGLVENVTVLIGMAVNDRPVAGVIHQPFYKSNGSVGRTIWGMKGLGVRGIDVTEASSSSGFTVTTTRSHSNVNVDRAIQMIAPKEVLRVGGAGYKIIMLLEGKANAYVFPTPGCKKWDICAPEAVIVAAGGILTDVHGDLYKYNKDVEFANRQGVLAALTKKDYEFCSEKLKGFKIT